MINPSKETDSHNDRSKILTKVEKIEGLDNKISYLKAQISLIQNEYGNKSLLLYSLIEKLIKIYKDKADLSFESKKYSESLSIYKTCLKYTEPLPGSNWEKYPTWSIGRINVMKCIAFTYEKLEQYEQAAEYLRLGMNLEDTFGISDDNYDSRYNQLFYLIGNKLVLMEQYSEALKYLVKVEKKMNDDYHIKEILNKKRLDKKSNANFIKDTPSRYINVLKLISKSYIKLGNYSQGDIYYEKESELLSILQRDPSLSKSLFSENNEAINTTLFHSLKTEDNHNNIKNSNVTEKRGDSAEGYDEQFNVNNTTHNFTVNRDPVFKKKNISQRVTEGQINEKEKRSQSVDKSLNVDVPIRNNKRKVTREQEQKLKQIIQETNKYPPLNLKLKKPIYPKMKKLPMIEPKSLPHSKEKAIINEITKKSYSTKKTIKKQGKIPMIKPKETTLTNKINKKLEDIQITLKRQTSLNTITSCLSQVSKNRKSSIFSRMNGTFSSFKGDEDEKEVEQPIKESTFKKEIRNKSTSAHKNKITENNKNKSSSDLPPIRKSDINKRISSDNQSFNSTFKINSKLLNYNEDKFKDQKKKFIENEKRGSHFSIVKPVDFRPTLMDFKKDSFSISNSRFSPRNPESGNNNPSIQKNDENKKITIDKTLLDNIKIFPTNSGIIDSKVLSRHKNIDIVSLICEYFVHLDLVSSSKYEKVPSFRKRHDNDQIWIIKSINNSYCSINFSIPLLEKKISEFNGPFISIDIFFSYFGQSFLSKYNIKLKIFNELQSSSDDLVDSIQNRLNSKNKKVDLVWTIVLFFFENWFLVFRNKYEKTIQEEHDQTKKAFYATFIGEINDYISKIAKWESTQTMMISSNKHISILLKYFNAFAKYLEVDKSIIGNEIKFKEIPEELIKHRRKCVELNELMIFEKMNTMNQVGNTLLLKKILFDSFQIDRYSRFTKKDKSEDINDSQLIIDYSENLFYDGCIIFKGILPINTKYFFLTISIRTFEKAIEDSNMQNLIELPLNKLVSKSKIINFEKLKFLSIHPVITKLYEDLINDLNKKFYDKTEYKTFIQLTLIDLTSGSNWYDISYLSWEILLKICNLLQKDIDSKYVNNWDLSYHYISKKLKFHPFLSSFLTKFIEKNCTIDNGSFCFLVDFNRDHIYNNIFMGYYDHFDHFNEFAYQLKQKISKSKNPDNQMMTIKFDHLYFYQTFLKEINWKYLKLFFKQRKYYQEEKMLIQEIDVHQRGIKRKSSLMKREEDDEEILKSKEKLSFHLFLTIKNIRYLILFKIFNDEQHIVPEGDIKNYLISQQKQTKLFIQFRNIISNQLLHSVVSSKRCITHIINCYENNEQSLTSYVKSLINILNSSYGKRAILDFTFNTYSLKTQKAIECNLNLIKRISLMLLNQNNDNLQKVIDDIKYVKTYKRCFKQKNGKIFLFNYQIFKENQINPIDNKKQLDLKRTNESSETIQKNLYSMLFGKFKMSKFEKRISKAYQHNYNYKYESVSYYLYFIDIYIPKQGTHVNFVLSSRDLNIILKKIKNKNVHDKYFLTYEEFVNLIPRKITISNEFSGKKVLLNFTKYKQLRMDWKEQMEQKSKSNLLTHHFKKAKEKFELILYLKPNYLNISIKDSLYDISTNELKLVIKTIKIYQIRDKTYSCLVSIFYHRILEYWTLILFFPHNSRKFISVLEPREVSQLIQSNNFMEMDVVNDDAISEGDIWKHVIASSKISSNIEGNAYFEVFTTKLLLKEFLYNGFEIISDGYNDELNRVIYIEITIKTKQLFLLEPIENIIDKVELDCAHLIFQSFSFHDLSWHKENFKLEDFESVFPDKVISNTSVVKVKEMSKEEILATMHQNQNKTGQLVPKIIETSKIEIRKFFQFALLRKLTIPIIKPYVSSQQHVFEMQMKSIENKGFDEGSLIKLIENIKYDRAHRKAISSIYKQKLENQILFQRIYSEFISYNPPILASISLNLVKEIVFITLFYPYQTNSFDLSIDFATIKELFFPYFNDILIIDKQELGKRILKRYEDFIKKSPAFIKLLRHKSGS